MILTVQSLLRPSSSDVVTIASSDTDGVQGNGASSSADLSSDGRYVVFQSSASNLIANDTNGERDIFRKDLHTGEIMRVSTAFNGAQSIGSSSSPEVSADGRYVIFSSFSPNLVEDDQNQIRDVFWKDLAEGTIIRVTTGTNGEAGNANSYSTQLSANGQYVLFHSASDNLVKGDTNGVTDVFLKDVKAGTLRLISTPASGIVGGNGSSYKGQLSADGRYVFFESDADNLVEGDTNEARDIFRKDLLSPEGEIIRVSTSSTGMQLGAHHSNVQLSANGRYIVFASDDIDPVTGGNDGKGDILRKDLVTGEVIAVVKSINLLNDSFAQLSADGRYVVFESDADNLVPGDTNGTRDIFRKDLVKGEILRLSVAPDGTQVAKDSYSPQISPDGRYVVFESGLWVIDSTGIIDFQILRVDTTLVPHAAAIAEGRYVQVTLGVGSASSVTLAWGDGTSDTVTPAGGSASFSHAYATPGSKAAVATVTENGQSWSVPYVVDLATGQMTRNTALADTVSGGQGNDPLTGDAAANVLIGNGGNDTLDGGAGGDVMNGGLGNDVYYVDNAADVVSELAGQGLDSVFTSVSFALGAEVENLTATGSAAISLTGSAHANTLTGNTGRNTLKGGAGNDKLWGGLGQDTLWGQAGRDTFAFDDRHTGTSKSRADYLADFSGRGGDKIDLRAVDANTKRGGDQNFSFIGTKAFSKAGEVRYEKAKGYTYVYLTTDSDRSAEAVLKIKGAMDLQKGWFVL